MLKALRLRARKFRSETDGSMSVETVLIFPLLLWFYLSTFTYFDAYRAQSTNIKATYTIADAISRELNGVDAAYLKTMHELLHFLNNSAHNMRMRVTVFTRDPDDDNKLVLRWSCRYGNGGAGFLKHTQTTLEGMDALIPPSPKPDELVMVETFIDYAPPFSARLFDDEVPADGMLESGNSGGLMIGLSPTTFNNVVVSRPRSVNQIKLQDGNCA